jgi:hypothetical protein
VNQGVYPIISVTQKPVNLGQNICVGEIGQSYYNLYKQLYLGALGVKTKYVAFVEDDTLYNVEHFSYRPPADDVFCYNRHFWFLDKEYFWTKEHVGGFSTIVGKKSLVDYLSQVFDKYPEEPLPRNEQKYLVTEPGKYDEKLGFKRQKVHFFHTQKPLITFCYRQGTYGWPKRREKNSIVVTDLEDFGNAKNLRKKLCQKSV